MFSMKQPSHINKTLRDYCRKSTEESIGRIIDKYNLERNNLIIKNPLDDNNKPEFNLYGILIVLSITMFSCCFCKIMQ